MELLEDGDAVAADKGFKIDNLMVSIGCQIIHPPMRRLRLRLRLKIRLRPRLRHRLKIRLKIRLRIQRLPPGGAHGGKQLIFQRKKSQRTISGRASWLSRPRTVLAKRCGEIQMILTVVLINDRPTFMFYSSMLLYSCRLSEMRSK